MQCKCVIHMASGEVRRCGQIVFNHEESDYCKYHGKVWNDLCEPAPQDMYEPGVDKDYIKAYSNSDTGEYKRIVHKKKIDSYAVS